MITDFDIIGSLDFAVAIDITFQDESIIISCSADAERELDIGGDSLVIVALEVDDAVMLKDAALTGTLPQKILAIRLLKRKSL